MASSRCLTSGRVARSLALAAEVIGALMGDSVIYLKKMIHTLIKN